MIKKDWEVEVTNWAGLKVFTRLEIKNMTRKQLYNALHVYLIEHADQKILNIRIEAVEQ